MASRPTRVRCLRQSSAAATRFSFRRSEPTATDRTPRRLLFYLHHHHCSFPPSSVLLHISQVVGSLIVRSAPRPMLLQHHFHSLRSSYRKMRLFRCTTTIKRPSAWARLAFLGTVQKPVAFLMLVLACDAEVKNYPLDNTRHWVNGSAYSIAERPSATQP